MPEKNDSLMWVFVVVGVVLVLVYSSSHAGSATGGAAFSSRHSAARYSAVQIPQPVVPPGALQGSQSSTISLIEKSIDPQQLSSNGKAFLEVLLRGRR